MYIILCVVCSVCVSTAHVSNDPESVAVVCQFLSSPLGKYKILCAQTEL